MVLVVIAGMLFLLSLFLEGTYLSIPFFIASVVLTAVLFRSQAMIVSVFLLGVLYDVITFSHLGKTSMFCLLLVFLISLYERKFETKTVPFVFFMSIVAVSSYLLIFGSYSFLVQLLLSVLYATGVFIVLDTFQLTRKEK